MGLRTMVGMSSVDSSLSPAPKVALKPQRLAAGFYPADPTEQPTSLSTRLHFPVESFSLASYSAKKQHQKCDPTFKCFVKPSKMQMCNLHIYCVGLCSAHHTRSLPAELFAHKMDIQMKIRDQHSLISAITCREVCSFFRKLRSRFGQLSSSTESISQDPLPGAHEFGGGAMFDMNRSNEHESPTATSVQEKRANTNSKRGAIHSQQ